MNRVLGVVGTGLIGSSIGLRARENGLTVLGVDRSEHALDAALQRGAIDKAVTHNELYETADQIVIAASVMQCIAELRALAGKSRNATLVLDVASVKAPVIAAAQGVKNFVGTHPMAGSERSGAAAARSDLFLERPWAYTPVESAPLRERAVAFIESMGAVPVSIEAQRHDEFVAFTSHLPQLFATLFTQELAGRSDQAALLCGPAAHELLRLGESRLAVWKEIIETNHGNISAEMRKMAQLLETAAAELEKRDFGAVENAFKE